MDDPRKQQVIKPPRPLVGSLQKLPTYPWMFSWPMNAHDRIVLTNREYYRGFPCPPSENTSYPYKRHWQFRDHLSDDRAPPAALDLRGGPADIQNVTRYSPYLTPYPETFLGRENTRCYVGIERRNRDKCGKCGSFDHPNEVIASPLSSCTCEDGYCHVEEGCCSPLDLDQHEAQEHLDERLWNEWLEIYGKKYDYY